MELTEKLLQDVLNGHYDVAKAAADYEQKQETEKEMAELSLKINLAIKNLKWDAANATLDEIQKKVPKDSPYPQALRFEILLGQKQYKKAYHLASSISKAHTDNAGLQNQLAWTLVARPGLEKRDTALAEKIAERANTATKGKSPTVLDTLARAQFMNGRKKEAMTTEQKAVEISQGALQEHLKKTFASYQQGILPEATD